MIQKIENKIIICFFPSLFFSSLFFLPPVSVFLPPVSVFFILPLHTPDFIKMVVVFLPFHSPGSYPPIRFFTEKVTEHWQCSCHGPLIALSITNPLFGTHSAFPNYDPPEPEDELRSRIREYLKDQKNYYVRNDECMNASFPESLHDYVYKFVRDRDKNRNRTEIRIHHCKSCNRLYSSVFTTTYYFLGIPYSTETTWWGEDENKPEKIFDT